MSETLSATSEIAMPSAVWAELQFDEKGLIPAIAQDAVTNVILMVAWMDRDAFERTMATGKACYYSRSRQSAWMKGVSGPRQAPASPPRRSRTAEFSALAGSRADD